MKAIYFWQRIVSPHMASLAIALSDMGRKVIYIAEKEMSEDRARQGWTIPVLGNVELVVISTPTAVRKFAELVPEDSVNICQGIRSNGFVSIAQSEFSNRGMKYLVVMETVDDSGYHGIFKRIVYQWLFWKRHQNLQGILTIGWRTSEWVASRGLNRNRVFPFAYFLSDRKEEQLLKVSNQNMFTFVFVGRLVELKRVELLIHSLAKLVDHPFKLLIVGDGPLKEHLLETADINLPGRVHWMGKLSITEIPRVLAISDCLVLPSRHDGWGAVVTEALMVGTPAICSDACGSAVAVKASGVGGVFKSGDVSELSKLLEHQLKAGRVVNEDRYKLAEWAKCLGANAGAKYLISILDYVEHGGSRPVPPWEMKTK